MLQQSHLRVGMTGAIATINRGGECRLHHSRWKESSILNPLAEPELDSAGW